MCLALLCRIRTLHVFPGIRIAPHCLHTLLLICHGIFVLDRCAILRALFICNRATSGRLLALRIACCHRICTLVWAKRLILSFANLLLDKDIPLTISEHASNCLNRSCPSPNWGNQCFT